MPERGNPHFRRNIESSATFPSNNPRRNYQSIPYTPIFCKSFPTTITQQQQNLTIKANNPKTEKPKNLNHHRTRLPHPGDNDGWTTLTTSVGPKLVLTKTDFENFVQFLKKNHITGEAHHQTVTFKNNNIEVVRIDDLKIRTQNTDTINRIVEYLTKHQTMLASSNVQKLEEKVYTELTEQATETGVALQAKGRIKRRFDGSRYYQVESFKVLGTTDGLKKFNSVVENFLDSGGNKINLFPPLKK